MKQKSPILLLAMVLIFLQILSAQSQFEYPFLASDWEEDHFCNHPLRTLHVEEVQAMLQQLAEKYPVRFHYEEIGRSVENRPVYLVTMGSGPTRVLLWSQMHGDEPTATAALCDIFDYLLKRDDPFTKNILEEITILAVPMLNPDGAQQFRRRNAQDIDINRDARDQATPEGRLLFQLKEQYQPQFGFNLHDQSGRRTVGNTNELVAIALMAPPFNATDNDNPVRLRAKQIVSVMYQALGPYLYGHVAKYDADYMPRAFGDSMQNWGVSTILLESGGWFEDRDPFLQKMNFVVLLTSLKAIADDSYRQANPAVYDIIPENDKNLYDLLIRDVNVVEGNGIPPFKADVAIDYGKANFADPLALSTGRIVDLGDLDYFAAKDTIEGEDLFLAPGFIGILSNLEGSGAEIFAELELLLKNGCTTTLLPFRTEQEEKIAELRHLLLQNRFPGNVAGLLYLDAAPQVAADSVKILEWLHRGGYGLAAEDSTLPALELASWFRRPSGILNDGNQKRCLRRLSVADIHELTGKRSSAWKVPARGSIRRGSIADLVLYSEKPLQRAQIHLVLVKGHPVLTNEIEEGQNFPGWYWLPNFENIATESP